VSKICPKYIKCPIFLGTANSGADEIYKQLFCSAGEEKFKTCKRYLVSEATKKPVPLDVMPNSFMTVNEIIQSMQENGLLD
jgi:hypothetical protein